MWPPGWDSVEATDWHENFWFWAGIVFLFLLGIAEVISHRYGLRKDALIELRERDAEAQRKKEEKEHETVINGLEKQLEEANKKVAAVEKFQAQRRLTEDQKKAIIAAIAPFRGQKVTVSSALGDGEGRVYRDDFARVFEAAGWDHQGDHGLEQAIFARNVTGIVIFLHQINEQEGVSNNAINALIKVIGDLNLFEGGGTGVGSDIPRGELKFVIGHKAH
jgi:hypothetical protein